MTKALAIIPSYLRQAMDLEVLETALRTMRETAEDTIDVMVVDDGSPAHDLVNGLDGICAKYEAELVTKERNEGFSRTVNVGLRKALLEGRDAILVNSDVEFGLTKDWVGLMQRQPRSDGEGLASVVGALLLYPNGLVQHGGIYFSFLTRDFGHRFNYGPGNLPEAQVATVCPVTGALQFIRHECLTTVGLYDESFCSPGDELVRTSHNGDVPIGELESGMGLVTLDYAAAGGRIIRGERGNRWGPGGGKSFSRSSHHWSGDLLAVHVGPAMARVTPGHRLRVRWTEEALSSTAVYLMRRGEDFRVGTAMMSTRAARTFGPRIRQLMEDADELWILRLFQDAEDALLYESAVSVDFGLPQTLFRVKEGNKRSQVKLDAFWAERETLQPATELLSAHGRDLRYPLLTRAPGYMGGTYHGFLTSASNLISESMTAGRDPGRGTQQVRERIHVERAPFTGRVYALDVPPYHYYISGGVGVHNSLGWEDVDFCVRTWLSKRECVYQPGVRAVHHEQFTRGQARADSKIARWTNESWMRFAAKYADVNFAAFVPNMMA